MNIQLKVTKTSIGFGLDPKKIIPKEIPAIIISINIKIFFI